MASYQNGHPHYNQNAHPSSTQNSGHPPHTSQSPYPPRPLHRSPSFDAGDDQRFADVPDPSYRATHPYQAQHPSAVASSPPVDRGTSITYANQASSLPFRTNTQHGSPAGGYQYQHQPTPPAHQTYNPAQFQQQQQQQQQSHQYQYNPQAYASPQTSYTPVAHQPYVPAAYGDSNLQRHTSLYNSYGYHDANSQLNYSAQPPLPPPRSDTLPLSHSLNQYGTYPQDTNQHHLSGHPSNASPRQNYAAYSPPPPQPPPHEASLAARPYMQSVSMPEGPYSHESTPSGNQSATLANYSSPDVNRNSSFASRVSAQSTSPRLSLANSPNRMPASRSPQRQGTIDRHPQGRSLPGVPSGSESDNDFFSASQPQAHRRDPSTSGYDDLMQHLDHAIGDASTLDSQRHTHMYRQSQDQGPDSVLPTPSPQPLLSPDEAPTHLNGNIASTGDAYINYGAFTDDSDAEAAAGLAAMNALDEQERAEDMRRRSGTQGSATLFPTAIRSDDHSARMVSQDQSSDSDYTGYDLSGAAGGSYVPDMSYGESQYGVAATMPSSDLYGRLNTRMSSIRSSGVSSEGRDSQTSGVDSLPPTDNPFSPIHNVARVDTGGTGGLTEPSPFPRRLSYEDGDEATLIESEAGQTSGSTSPSRDSMPDLFFHPGMSQQRPLPPPPSNSDPSALRTIPHLIPAGTYTQQSRFSQYTDPGTRVSFPSAPDAYSSTLLSPTAVPRSTSLSSTRSAPRSDHPIRSKTESDRAKLLRQQGRPMSDIYDLSSPQTAVGLDLPTIPKKRYNPSKLTSDQFKKCSEPWALSSVLAWIRELAEEEADLKESSVAEGLVALFMHKVPTMYNTEAEALGDRVVKSMVAAGALVREEEWVKFGPGTMSGVLYQLTGTGCYSSKLHLYPVKGRCYSYHCMRTLKKIDVDSLPGEQSTQDWPTFYKLKKEDLEGHDRKEIERQNNLHEVVTGEDFYLSQLDVIRLLYRDRLAASQPPIIPTKKLPGFLKEVFGGVDKVKKVNQDYLLGQLKYRQTEQGPWIVGFSDIFREWIRKARPIYVEYAASFPRADYLMRREAERNLHFKNFLDQAQNDARSKKLDWGNYLKSPITRLQRYGLLLSTVYKNMPKESEEKTNLAFALDEIRAATFECDAKFAEMGKKMELIEMQTKLRLRAQMEKEVELNLDHLGREIVFKGDLLRAGEKGFQWVETFAILFDHYLVLAKPLARERSREGYYDVSKVPIPMDLLVLESAGDAAVVKSSVKGIAAVTTTVATRSQTDSRMARAQSAASGDRPGSLTHTNTNLSIGSGGASQSMVPITTLDSGNPKEEKIMYPFRVKHLGKPETYTLYAPSAQNRQDWCEAIIQAKTRHAESLYSQNAEPFKLRVLADTAFGYDGLSHGSRRILIRGTPLDRAIRETEKKYEGQGRPAPICRAQVNCATVFHQPFGRLMCAIGTDYGVYISEYQNSRGWTRAIQMQRISQIAVLEEFNLFLLISDKALIAYHLDVVCPPSGSHGPRDDSARKAPQKLSGSKDIGFFVTGRMKERTLVFYKKRDGIASTFKVLEPVLQKSTTTRSRFLPSSTRRGQTEFFREYDEFYIPAECYGLNLYQSSLAISTARGVEVLTLEKKQTWSVPNLRSDQADTQAHLSSIASRIKDLKPLGMFRLGEAEFLVTFEECAVYVNKHGDISRGVVMEFVGRAKSACLYSQYLILVDDDFVEIRDAQNGRLKQVVAGKDIKLLDDGGGGSGSGTASQQTASLGGGMNGLGLKNFANAPRTPKIVLQHPEYEKSHIVVELILTQDEE
ncbi:hypothetical protein PV10_05750 [Exophiala mesophila]|uniref:Rho1 guanine nucleotide exchange factor 3 n=1 Tax=Exophiala mesophila TaxID=212818 RepID=A0A0D1XSR8_EXOME|nr:uncharacterized protein PV10_05750 [Exophiala mesophila]KIV91186.1 hypothetical protein PV10_05750 [Exophiala mesophila]